MLVEGVVGCTRKVSLRLLSVGSAERTGKAVRLTLATKLYEESHASVCCGLKTTLKNSRSRGSELTRATEALCSVHNASFQG